MAKRKRTTGNSMIPCTENVMSQMMAHVLTILGECGLVERGQGEEATADHVMEILRAQGAMSPDGDGVVFGRCLLLPQSSPDEFRLLLVTPSPAPEYTEDLLRKPSPVRFERTARGEIIISGRWIADRLEELANNPSAPPALKTEAMNASRRGIFPPTMVLSRQVETVALAVAEQDGTMRLVEALPAGCTIAFTAEGEN